MTTIILNTGITAAVSFIIGGVLSWICAWARHRCKQRKKEKSLLEDLGTGMMYLLKQDIIDRCDKMLDQQKIDLDEWDDLRAENEIYLRLHGNGDAKERMKLVKEKVKKQELNG
ncbi:ATP synthase subunit I [Eubacterium sp. AB3007]|uniref:ATP synthase subunit I n=1 Tax=Eubacterium sp. AB3007 TaxID=1392487 RepID=UPI00048903A9|nr:ATP synthase subunit I [Eubacterium sp. AB3007]